MSRWEQREGSRPLVLGSARASRAGFGASPKQALPGVLSQSGEAVKFALAGAPAPAREARALPDTTAPLRPVGCFSKCTTRSDERPIETVLGVIP